MSSILSEAELKKLPRPIRKEPAFTTRIMHLGPGAFFRSFVAGLIDEVNRKVAENWGIIEDLADTLGAATACSKPVSDLVWRPHSEHVGQTGKPVSTNLYIAIGISGAIQHLAGVSSSKVKVVINTDPEAPFFKAADYGIVGDAFEVVPKLNEKLKAFKAENN